MKFVGNFRYILKRRKRGGNMKDFKDSYEQKRWEMAARFHASASEALQKVFLESTKQHLRQRIEELEERYPQLKIKEKKHA